MSRELVHCAYPGATPGEGMRTSYTGPLSLSTSATDVLKPGCGHRS
jgi:hypothetical protein